MCNSVIKVNDVTKIYKLYNKHINRLKESLSISKKNYHTDFYALRDISFEINKGETVGIIGTNGSGKSTLLKIITGVLSPTKGSINVNGKVSALLELGAGFNPNYTGIENIYLNGTMMGFTKKEMDEKIQSIVDFADIGEFVYQMVKTYSSGMFARLAFSVAINVEPDLLIVDEALSVGDMAFQEKSITKMKELKELGTTILFVTHSLPTVRNFCERAIWLKNGNMYRDGRAEIVCDEYNTFMMEQDEKIKVNELVSEKNGVDKNKKIIIRDVKTNKKDYMMDEDIEIEVDLEFKNKIIDYGVGILVYDSAGNMVTLFNTIRDDIVFNNEKNKVYLKIPKNDFVNGKYFITVIVSDELAMFAFDKAEFILSFIIKAKLNKSGIPIADGYFRSKHTWE